MRNPFGKLAVLMVVVTVVATVAYYQAIDHITNPVERMLRASTGVAAGWVTVILLVLIGVGLWMHASTIRGRWRRRLQ